MHVHCIYKRKMPTVLNTASQLACFCLNQMSEAKIYVSINFFCTNPKLGYGKHERNATKTLVLLELSLEIQNQ